MVVVGVRGVREMKRVPEMDGTIKEINIHFDDQTAN